MLRLDLKLSEDTIYPVTIDNVEVIKFILSIDENDFREILIGILDESKLSINQFLIIFAGAGNKLKQLDLNPAQTESLKMYLTNFKI